jgi:hypothetical protein
MLGNMLDLSNAQLFASQETLSEQNSMLPGYSELTGLKYYVDTETDKLVLYKFSSHNASVTLNKEADAVVTFIQDGVTVAQKVNRGGTTTINITQK